MRARGDRRPMLRADDEDRASVFVVTICPAELTVLLAAAKLGRSRSPRARCFEAPQPVPDPPQLPGTSDVPRGIDLPPDVSSHARTNQLCGQCARMGTTTSRDGSNQPMRKTSRAPAAAPVQSTRPSTPNTDKVSGTHQAGRRGSSARNARGRGEHRAIRVDERAADGRHHERARNRRRHRRCDRTRGAHCVGDEATTAVWAIVNYNPIHVSIWAFCIFHLHGGRPRAPDGR